MHRKTTILAVAATVSMAACGGSDEPTRTARSAEVNRTADVSRYCALTKKMDRAGTQFFARLEADDSATAADYEKAERDFLRRYARQLAEIEQVAPPEIRSEIALILKAQRERSGLESTKTPEAETTAAEKRVRSFEKREC